LPLLLIHDPKSRFFRPSGRNITTLHGVLVTSNGADVEERLAELQTNLPG